jgi:hypothetical protein
VANVDPLFPVVQAIRDQIFQWLPWVVCATLFLFALKSIVVPWRRGKLGESRVGAVLDRLGAETLHDVILPDGRGGLTQVDHLVLTGAGLLVVETKNYSGLILGQEREAQWTQRLGRQSYTFQNPLRQNYAHTEAVKALVPEVRVFGRVVFTDAARFPKGLPTGVSSLSTLRTDLRHELTDGLDGASPSASLRTAWETLTASADRSRGARKAHLEGIAKRRGPDRGKWAAPFILAISGLGLVGLALRTGLPGPERVTPESRPRFAPAPVVTPALSRSGTTADPVRHASLGLQDPPDIAATPAHRTGPPLTPQRTTKAPVPPPLVADQGLDWSDQSANQGVATSPECNAAIAALLIDNSEQKRQRRDRVCGR